MSEQARTVEATQESDNITTWDVLLVLVENIRLLVLAPVLVSALAVGMSFLFAPTYTAFARILPPQQQQSAAAALLASQLGALAGVAGVAAGLKNPADTYVAMIKSRTVADRLISRFRLRQVYGEEYDHDARRELAKRTRIGAGRDGLISIEVDDHNPKRAAEIANAYIEGLRELTQQLAVSEAAQRRLFFENQLKQTKNELVSAEVELRGSGISENTLKTMPQSALEGLARLKAQVTAQEIRLGAMRGYMTESNPEFRQGQRELEALRSQLAKSDQMDNARSRGAGAEYIAKYRNFKYYETLFELMAKQYEMAKLDEAREGAVIQIIDAAIPPERSSQPKRVLVAVIAGIAALLVALLVVLLRRALRLAALQPELASKLERLRRSLSIGPR